MCTGTQTGAQSNAANKPQAHRRVFAPYTKKSLGRGGKCKSPMLLVARLAVNGLHTTLQPSPYLPHISVTSPPPSLLNYRGSVSVTLRWRHSHCAKLAKSSLSRNCRFQANFIIYIYIGPNKASWGHKNKYTDITCVTVQSNKNSHCVHRHHLCNSAA